jgi:uncharacterized Zn-finger protein
LSKEYATTLRDGGYSVLIRKWSQFPVTRGTGAVILSRVEFWWCHHSIKNFVHNSKLCGHQISQNLIVLAGKRSSTTPTQYGTILGGDKFKYSPINFMQEIKEKIKNAQTKAKQSKATKPTDNRNKNLEDICR